MGKTNLECEPLHELLQGRSWRSQCLLQFFFFNAPATTEIYTPLYTLSLHDALPISRDPRSLMCCVKGSVDFNDPAARERSEEHTSELQSHSGTSYAVFCVKKKKMVMHTPFSVRLNRACGLASSKRF